MTRRGSMPFKNDDSFLKYHSLAEPLRNRPDYGENGDNVNDVLNKLKEEDEKKIKSVVNRITSSIIQRKAGLYSRLKQDLTRHGPRLMLVLMGDACEKISDELRLEGRDQEARAWEKNIELLYVVAKKVKYG